MTPMEGVMTLTSSGMGAGTVVSVFVAGPTGLPELSDTTVVVRPARILLGAGKSSFTMTSRKTRIILGVYISRKIRLVNSAHLMDAGGQSRVGENRHGLGECGSHDRHIATANSHGQP